MLRPQSPIRHGVAVPRTRADRSVARAPCSSPSSALLAWPRADAAPAAAPTAPQMRPGSCSRATPGSAPGWRSRSDSRTTAPPIVGELRLAGGSQGGTRFSVAGRPADPSDKTYVLYAQPPSFGQQLEVVARRTATRSSPARRSPSRSTTRRQLIVGVVAERPQGIVGGHPACRPGQNRQAPVDRAARRRRPARAGRSLVGARPARSGRTSTATRSSTEQLDGAARLDRRRRPARSSSAARPGSASCRASPTTSCPTVRRDRRRRARVADTLLGAAAGRRGRRPGDGRRADPRPRPGHRRRPGRRRRARLRQRRRHDPRASTRPGWLAATGPPRRCGAPHPAADRRWPVIGRRQPDRQRGLAAARRSPCRRSAGCSLLLVGYIVLIGPINYLVLRRLDRREWAWVTMPVLIAVFAVGAYGFGSALRGSDIIVNEVAIVRGAPDATEGTAQVYLGVFSPTRGTYQVAVPGGALLSAPDQRRLLRRRRRRVLDVIQGDPPAVRDLVGRLRLAADDPGRDRRSWSRTIQADLRLVDGSLERHDPQRLDDDPREAGGRPGRQRRRPRGHRRRARGSRSTLRSAAQPVRAVPVRPDLRPDLLRRRPWRATTSQRRNSIRHRIVDQLTYDPMSGNSGRCRRTARSSWPGAATASSTSRSRARRPRASANILYYVPVADARPAATIALRADLIRSTVIVVDAAFFNKDPFTMNIGQGSGHDRLPADRRSTARFTATEASCSRWGSASRSTCGAASRSSRSPAMPRRRSRRRTAPTADARADDPQRGLRRHARDRDLRPDDAGPGSACRTSTRDRPTTSRTPRATSTRDGTILVRFVNDHPEASGFRSTSRSRGSSDDDDRPDRGLVKRYTGTLAVAGLDLDVARGRDLRPRRPERGRQDDDAADPRDAPRRRPSGEAEIAGDLRSPEPRRRSAASSASCRTSSGSTTT